MGDGRIVSVTGGAGGVDARQDDEIALGAQFQRSAAALLGEVDDIKGYLVDADVLASAVLSPGTAAGFETAVTAATIGPGSAGLVALDLEVDGVTMVAVAAAHRDVEALVAGLYQWLEYGRGYLLGAAAPLLLLGGGLSLATPGGQLLLALGYTAVDDPAERAALIKQLQGFIEDHPGLVEELVDSQGGLIDGLLAWAGPPGSPGWLALRELGLDPLHLSVGDAASDLSSLWFDGVPVVGDPRLLTREDLAEQLRTAEDVDAMLRAPGSVRDLLNHLRLTNDARPGEIDIQEITTIGPDGRPITRYAVYLPGTDTWNLPGQQTSDVRDLGANIRLVGGIDTAYMDGIEQAMRASGVPDGADVMLVGHSQGGMTAAALAADDDFSHRYDVSHVVTAGAPTAQVPSIPSHTQVLSLENTGDVVPLLDGESNPDQDNRTTVRFDGRTGSVGGNHDLGVYTRGGAAVDRAAATDPSLGAYVDSLRADGYLDADATSRTTRVRITQEPR
jgi:hypothetical protein